METNPFHHLRQKHSIDYNQPIEACEEEIRAAVTQQAVVGALASSNPNNKKNKRRGLMRLRWRRMALSN